MPREFEERFEDRVTVLGADSHLEMAYEDAVANPLVGSQAYNDYWQDAAFDDMQEYTYEDEQDHDPDAED